VFLTGVDKLEAYLTKELREDSIHWSCEELGFYGRKEMLLHLMVPRLGLSGCFSLHVKKLSGIKASLFVWLVLLCSERKVLLSVCWFVLRENYCWLAADKSHHI
jgi:hypothetical protein